MAIHTPDLNQDALNKLQAQEQFPQVQEKRVQQVEIAKDTIQWQVALALEMMKAWEVPKIDILKLPHYASLSPEIQKYFFNWNRADYQLSNFKTWDIEHRGQEPKVEWNLQYLIWPEWVSSYLALSKEHQQFIQDLANLLLTDEYAKDIEKNKRNHSRKYEKIEWTKLKTWHLALLLKKSLLLIRDIETITSWVDKRFKSIISTSKKYEEKKWYNVDSKLYELLETLKPEVEAVEKVHEFLRKKGLEREMDNRKKSEVILAEIKRIEAQIKEKDIKIKEKDIKIKELDKYLQTLKRLSWLVWVYK